MRDFTWQYGSGDTNSDYSESEASFFSSEYCDEEDTSDEEMQEVDYGNYKEEKDEDEDEDEDKEYDKNNKSDSKDYDNMFYKQVGYTSKLATLLTSSTSIDVYLNNTIV